MIYRILLAGVVLIGAKLLEEGHTEQAEPLFRYAAEWDYRPGKLALGLCLRDLGRPVEAKTCLEDAGEKLWLAFTLDDLGLHEESTLLYAELLTDDPITWLNLAGALRDSGHDASGWYWSVLSATPPADPVHSLAAFVLAEDLHDPILLTLARNE